MVFWWFCETWQVIAPSEGVVALHAAPRGQSDDVDRAVVAPQRKAAREGWVGQAAARHGDEFSWLAFDAASDRRRDSVDSLVEVVKQHSSNKLILNFDS